MKSYLRGERVVKAVRWGPSWEAMERTTKELGGSGISLRFNDDGQQFDSDEEYGLPRLFIFTSRWDRVEVRIGDWIVISGYRRWQVVSAAEFREEYSEIIVALSDIDLDDLETEVRRLAAESPSRVSRHACPVYVERKLSGGWCGSCIFGVALVNLGVNPAELHAAEGMGIGTLLTRCGFEESSQIEWFRAVQAWQDDHTPWGRSVQLADPEVGAGAGARTGSWA